MTKKICTILYFASLILIARVSSAQSNMSYLVADVETELMKTRLSLTEEQERQVTEINKQYLESRKSISAERGLPFNEFNKKMEKIEQEKNLKLKRVLDKKQWEIYCGKRNDINGET
jgi:hypothetical protein